MRSKIGRGEGEGEGGGEVRGSRLAFIWGSVGLVRSLEKSDEADCDD